jgi:hypothetical protein
MPFGSQACAPHRPVVPHNDRTRGGGLIFTEEEESSALSALSMGCFPSK